MEIEAQPVFPVRFCSHGCLVLLFAFLTAKCRLWAKLFEHGQPHRLHTVFAPLSRIFLFYFFLLPHLNSTSKIVCTVTVAGGHSQGPVLLWQLFEVHVMCRIYAWPHSTSTFSSSSLHQKCAFSTPSNPTSIFKDTQYWCQPMKMHHFKIRLCPNNYFLSETVKHDTGPPLHSNKSYPLQCF